MTAKKDFFDRVEEITENILTRRKRAKRIKKEKAQKKNIILDWLEAFLWAASVVLLVNQYLFQAYQIPSGSMIDTLLIGDRIFVNKLIYGPELLPGLGKLPSPIKPQRNDIIIFENPSYPSRGPVFDIAQRIIYMLTLSFVDIDRDESGEPQAHFLIKRAVGMGGDQFVSREGNLSIRFAGENRWVDENEYHEQAGHSHRISRLFDVGLYPIIEAAGKARAYRQLGLPVPAELAGIESRLYGVPYPDPLAMDRARVELLRAAAPHETRLRDQMYRYTLGWYVPENHILPLGDNRDNSRDGRYFGPVGLNRILGNGSIIYWPVRRMRIIR